MGNCCGGDKDDDDATTTDGGGGATKAGDPPASVKSAAAAGKTSAAGQSAAGAGAAGGPSAKTTATKRGVRGTRPPPPSHATKPKGMTETNKGITGVIVHKDGQRMRKPAMEVQMNIPDGPGMLANPQQQQEAQEQPVRIEHILELPPKAVRGPPPLTPFPEPPKSNVVTSLADPPGGWSHYDTSSTTSTSTNDIIGKIPLLSYGLDNDESSSGKSVKGAGQPQQAGGGQPPSNPNTPSKK